MNDLNVLVNDTMTNIVEKHKNEAMKRISKYSAKTQSEINKELKKFKKELFEDIPNIEAIEARFKLVLSEELRDILIKKSNSDKFIHIESQGEGVKRRIWFAFIKWNAMKVVVNTDKFKKFIWCFDEPETHLYPAAQRVFFDIIKKLSSTNIQSIISTHSTIFTDKTKFETIKSVNLVDKYTVVSKCDTVDDIFDCLQLKNSDFLFFDKFLAVEGDTEEILIPYLYNLFSGKSLSEKGIQLIKLNSKSKKIQNQKILEQIVKDFKKPDDCLVFILDNDSQFDDRTLLGKKNIKLIGKQDVEDSIDNSVWVNLINSELGISNFVTKADIAKIKAGIPNTIKISKDDKFYRKLQIYIRRKKNDIDGSQIMSDILPDKGKSSGEMLIKYITKIKQVDPKIKEAFELLENEYEK